MKVKLLLASCCLLLAVLACSVPGAGKAGLPSPAPSSPAATALPVPTATPTQDWLATSSEAGPLTPAQNSPEITALPVPTATPILTGVIAGTLIYPGEYIPAQRVVAFDVANPSVYYWVQTQTGQATFELPVPPGTYYVVAYLLNGSMAAGYSQAVLCGMKYECNDHSLIPVLVRAGERVNDVRPHDWYAPSGAFPPMP